MRLIYTTFPLPRPPPHPIPPLVARYTPLLLSSLLLGTVVLLGAVRRRWRRCARLVDVVVAPQNAGALGIAEPRVLLRALTTRFHVASVGYVGRLRLEGQRALDRRAARLLDGRLVFGAVPRLVFAVDGLQGLGIGDPGERLRGGDEPDVGPASGIGTTNIRYGLELEIWFRDKLS